jgi:Ca2+-binding RTX toxin-like protein
MALASHFAVDGHPLAEYLDGDRLTIVSQIGGYYAMPLGLRVMGQSPPAPSQPQVKVTVLDVSDRTSPHVVQSNTLDGMLVDSRAVGSRVYLVVQNGFTLPRPEILGTEVPPAPDPWPGPIFRPLPIVWDDLVLTPAITVADPTGVAGPITVAATPQVDLPAVDLNALTSAFLPWRYNSGVYETQEQYLARIGDQVLDLVLPHLTSYGPDGTQTASGLLTEAIGVYRPEGTEETTLTSVVAFDMARSEAGPASSVGVPTQGGCQVYASQQDLYLLETQWGANSNHTAVHKLNLAAAGMQVDLVAQGEVPGAVVNQFSVDEHGGDLRIATTSGWGQDAASGVYVLRQDGDQLDVVGQVDGLAPGEQIYSVRFLDDLAYVVTFRRMDPLWAIDLSHPESPRVVGELEIPGFSNYLHQVGDGYLVGLGRNADPITGAWQSPQLSLFDVADPANPRQLDRFTIDVGDWGWSEAFDDHHAINYYPDQHVLAVSVACGGSWTIDPGGTTTYLAPETKLWVFQVEMTTDAQTGARQGSLDLLGTIKHDTAVRRSVRVGEVLYAVSDDTVTANDIFHPSVEIARVFYGTDLLAIGPVDSDQVTGPDASQDEQWYDFRATREGQITVEASASGTNKLFLTLYDDRLRALSTSKAPGGRQRIDLSTLAGKHYYLRVRQVAPAGQSVTVDTTTSETSAPKPFTLRLTNLVRKDAKGWTVSGTPGNDRFELDTTAGSLVVNGTKYPFTPGKVTSFTFQGGKGNDVYKLAARKASLAVVETAGVDQLDFSSSAGPLTLDLGLVKGQTQKVRAGGNTLQLSGFMENVIGTRFADTIHGNTAKNTIDGGAGDDWLYAGAGNARLIGGPGNNHLFGGNGNDILDGGPGTNTITPGQGKDVVLQRKSDTLVGVDNNDLVLSCNADSAVPNAAALDKVLAAWTGPGSDLARLKAVVKWLPSGVSARQGPKLGPKSAVDWLLMRQPLLP